MCFVDQHTSNVHIIIKSADTVEETASAIKSVI